VGDAQNIVTIAAHLMRQYGDEAEQVAAERAGACDADGDDEAALVWRRVVRAVRGFKSERGPLNLGRPCAPARPDMFLSDSHVRAVFDAAPHPYLLLRPDLKIVDANRAYLDATMCRRDQILGRDLFDVFPDNPELPEADGAAKLKASLTRVIDGGKADRMAVQRYDIRDRDGHFAERWWSPHNVPAFAEDGRLLVIIHHVEDVTAQVSPRPSIPRNGRARNPAAPPTNSRPRP
jgi:PAS domain S-box-containing protein